MIRFVVIGALVLCGSASAQTPAGTEARLPPPYFRAYVVAVCAASEEISDDCIAQGLRHSAYALSEMYLRGYRGQPLWNSLRLRFPYGWAEASQARFLREVEQGAIATARDQIARDIAAVSPGDRAPEKRDRLQSWQTQALAEALSGDNWSHDWPDYRHDFAPAEVMRQLAQADLKR